MNNTLTTATGSKTIDIEQIRLAITQARISTSIGRRPSNALNSELKGLDFLAAHIENVIRLATKDLA